MFYCKCGRHGSSHFDTVETSVASGHESWGTAVYEWHTVKKCIRYRQVEEEIRPDGQGLLPEQGS